VIEAAALRLKGTAADGIVSKADLVVLAAAYGVRITGGPAMRVAVGRLDAAAADPDGRMPELDFSAQQQLANFADKGLDAQEFVALCGSHTVRATGWLAGWEAGKGGGQWMGARLEVRQGTS
jgi:hypothetical protein